MNALLSITFFTIILALPSSSIAAPIFHEEKCTNSPCPNTKNGEDPEKIDIREGASIEKRLRNNPDDKKRWSSLILFSDTTDKNELSMAVLKGGNFNLELDPGKGAIIFKNSNGVSGFRIADISKFDKNPCPQYQIRVVEADMDYAIIRKTCPEYEYRPGRYYKSNDYYLYDARSTTVRSLWSASTLLGKGPSPVAKPNITLRKTDAGYIFDWIGIFPSDNPPAPMEIHNIYKWSIDDKGRKTLVCFDASNPTHLAKENEKCESQILDRISLIK